MTKTTITGIDAYDRISDICARHPDDNIDMVFAGNDDLLATAQGSKNSRQFKTDIGQ